MAPRHVVVELVQVIKIESVATVLFLEGREAVDCDRRHTGFSRCEFAIAVIYNSKPGQTEIGYVKISIRASVESVVNRAVVSVACLVDEIRCKDMDPCRADILITPGDEIGEVRIVARNHTVGDIIECIPPEDLIILRNIVINANEDLIVAE